MRQRVYSRALLGTVAVITLVALIIIGFVVIGSSKNDNLKSTVIAAQPTANPPLTAITTLSATSIPPSPVPTTLSASPTVITLPVAPGLSVITPTRIVGQAINLPSGYSPGLNLIYSSAPPLITPQEALRIVYNTGVPVGVDAVYNGKTVPISAIHGIATFGKAFPDGTQRWMGPQNIAVKTCDDSRKCVLTGEVLKSIENRPMWILDYALDESVFRPVQPGACGVTVQCETHNHAAFAVDTKLKTVLYSWSYHAA